MGGADVDRAVELYTRAAALQAAPPLAAPSAAAALHLHCGEALSAEGAHARAAGAYTAAADALLLAASDSLDASAATPRLLANVCSMLCLPSDWMCAERRSAVRRPEDEDPADADTQGSTGSVSLMPVGLSAGIGHVPGLLACAAAASSLPAAAAADDT
jgi:hypothetical protein